MPPAEHVLHVADADFFIRFGRLFRHVALALDGEGVRSTLVTDDRAAVADLDGTPIECHWFESIRGWRAWNLPRHLARHLDPPPQLVHLWGTAGLRTVCPWALTHGIPVVVHAFSVADVQALLARGPRPGVHWLAASSGLIPAAASGSAPSADRFRILRPGLLPPESLVEAAPDDRTLAVVWAGRIDEHAGLDTLVDAVAQLRAKSCDLQVALLGAGPGVSALWAKIRQAQVQGFMTLVHQPLAWDHAMAGIDVCVVPARQTELSLMPLRAMSLGKVVICSHDQVADWFIADETAWQFTPGSAVELAYYLARAAGAESAARDLSRSAAAYARAQHSIGGMLTALLAVYSDVTEDTAAGTSGALDDAAEAKP